MHNQPDFICFAAVQLDKMTYYIQTYTPVLHTRFNGPFSGTTRVSQYQSTRKVKPIWISLKQETVSGIGIIWAICKSAPRSR